MWNQIRKFFSSEEEAVKPVVRQGAQRPALAEVSPLAPTGAPLASLDGDLLKAQLKAVLAHRPPEQNLVGGKVNLLNLAAIKERLGSKWPRYEQQVHEFVASTLQRRLSEKDFFTRSGEGSYLILFHDASETEAKLKCALLGQEISQRFFGEMGDDTGEGLQLDTVLASVDGGVVTQRISLADAISAALEKAEAESARMQTQQAGKLTAEEIQELLGAAEARFVELHGRTGAGQAPSLVEDRFNELIRQLANIESALAAEATRWTRLSRGDKAASDFSGRWRDRNASFADAIRAFIRRADQAIHEAKMAGMSAAANEDQEGALTLETTYLPIWSVKHESVGLYRCQSRIVVEAAVNAGADSAEEFQEKVADTIDRITLRRARAELQRIASSGLSCLLVVPISFSTLNRPASAQRYLPICHAVPKELRSMIVWEIRNAPVVQWTTNFVRIVEQLKPLGRAVFVLCRTADLPPNVIRRVLGKLQGVGIQGVGIDLTDNAIPEALMMRYLNRFAQAAEKEKLTSYLNGVGSVSLSTAASCTGIEHLSGDIVAPPVEHPEGIQQKALASMYPAPEATVVP